MRLAALGTIVLALAVGIAPAGAQQVGAPPAAGHRVAGTISSMSAGTMVVTGRDGAPVTVKTVAATKFIGRTSASAAAITPGDAVYVVADKAQDGSLTALAVQDVPAATGMPMRGRGGQTATRNGKTLVSGMVAQLRGGALSVSAADGTVTTVALPQSVKVSRLVAVPAATLAAGARVMVMGTSNPDGTMTASLILVAARATQ